MVTEIIDYTDQIQSLIELLEQQIELQYSANVYSEWLVGLNVTTFILLIILIFSIFLSNTR